MPHFVTGGGDQQRHCQVIAGPDGSGSERERLPSASVDLRNAGSLSYHSVRPFT